MRALRVVEGEELVENSEPPSVFLVGLVETIDFAIGLRPSNLAEAVLDVVVVEIPLESMVKTGAITLVRTDELRSVVCDHFENRNR